jgi:polysaccharide pyruvyl transferase WcaK-like protein
LALRKAGWDGETPVLAICPINPYQWPVTASIPKWLAYVTTGAYKKSHYRSLYFHRSGRDADEAFERYLSAIAGAVQAYRKSKKVFPILVAMEMLDREACEIIAQKIGGAPVFSSDKYDMYELVSILRASSRMLSSRFHAIVTSMPGGVPSAGITMDERIRNLMRERGHDHLLMKVDEPDLEAKALRALQSLDEEEDEIRNAMYETVARNLQLMARMGTYFEQQVARQYPEFPIRKGALSWEQYLPPLGPGLRQLLEEHSGVLAG